MKRYEQKRRPHYQVIKTIDKYYAGIEPETHCSQRAWCPEPLGYPFFMKLTQRFSVKDPLEDCL